MNVVEYDLTVEPRLADAAEAAARTRAREKEAREKAAAARVPGAKAPSPAPPPDPAEDEEDVDEKPESTASTSGKPMLDPELERVLSDPMRASRKRYLPPGRYTVEVRAGGATSSAPLRVKEPKAGDDADEDAPIER
jgi:hypothetical protein